MDLYSGGINSPTRPSIRASGADNIIVSASGSGATYINHDDGSGGVRFHDGTPSGEVMRIHSNGAVGIGTDSPARRLDVRGSFRVRSPSSNTVWLDIQSGVINVPGDLGVDGRVTASDYRLFQPEAGAGLDLCISNTTGLFSVCGSSGRYKRDVRDLEDAASMISALRPVRFSWVESGQEGIGLIAEDVAEVIPELAVREENGEITGVNYRHMVAVLIRAMEERRQQVDVALAARDVEIAALRTKLATMNDVVEHSAKLDARIAVLENLLSDGKSLAGDSR